MKVKFEHDYDSSLYMICKDPDAQRWKVIVHCEGGETHVPKPERFVAYPGTPTHEGEAAWPVEYFRPETIEIQRPGQESVIIKHPDRRS